MEISDSEWWPVTRPGLGGFALYGLPSLLYFRRGHLAVVSATGKVVFDELADAITAERSGKTYTLRARGGGSVRFRTTYPTGTVAIPPSLLKRLPDDVAHAPPIPDHASRTLPAWLAFHGVTAPDTPDSPASTRSGRRLEAKLERKAAKLDADPADLAASAGLSEADLARLPDDAVEGLKELEALRREPSRADVSSIERDVADPRFGAVHVRAHERAFFISGGLPDTRLLPGKQRDGVIRTPSARGTYRLGSESGTRGSYDVTAEVAGRAYVLHHRSRREAELQRDGTAVGRFRGPRRTWRSRTVLSPSMLEPYEVVSWSEAADEVDGGVGHALTAFYGPGACGLVRNLIGKMGTAGQ